MATKYPVRIRAAPHPGSIYWCDLHPENTIHIPEFWKKRPVLVVSRRGSLNGKVICLPMTTDADNATNPAAIEVSAEIRALIDNKRTWVITDHPMTVATSRLDLISKTPPKVKGTEFAAILSALHSAIVTPHPQVTTSVSVEETTTIIETPLGTVTEISDRVEIKIEGTPKG
jgi:mRNA interferase MazF